MRSHTARAQPSLPRIQRGGNLYGPLRRQRLRINGGQNGRPWNYVPIYALYFPQRYKIPRLDKQNGRQTKEENARIFWKFFFFLSGNL